MRLQILAGSILFLVGSIVSVSSAALAQLPPPKPSPLSPQVPQGPGGCSIHKSCAEVSPAIIQSALGLSPLAENLRILTDVIGGRVTGSPAADKAVGFAVEAFRHAGVDEVHTEKFTIPVG